MPIQAVADLVQGIQQSRLLEPEQLQALQGDLQGRFAEPKALARELLQRGWLTPYQINQLFLKRGSDLLLGSYVLLERLGEGGMGVVFKARNWKLGRVVALKIIRKERLSRPDTIRRFHREIQVAAQLSHPNVVHAYDADEVAGTHFFAMEYAEGFDLARLVKQSGPLPVERACDYVRQVALGLQHAHEHNLIHRDIKPSNLLLTKGEVVKILDMGLARLQHETSDEGSSILTQEGAVMGTPDYIAPEQALDAHLADIRADIYSLGCSFYYLLTGLPPLPAGTLMQKLLKHRMDEPEPVEKLRPGVPAGVAAIARRMMAKQPEDRYQTPGEVAAALAAWDAGVIQSAAAGHTGAATRAAAAAVQVAAAPPPAVAEAASETGVNWSSVMLPPSTSKPSSVSRVRRKANGWSWRRFNLIAGAVLLGCLGLLGYGLYVATRSPKPPVQPSGQDGKEPSFAELASSLGNPALRDGAIAELLRYPGRPEAAEAVLVGLMVDGPIHDQCRTALADNAAGMMPHLVEAARRGRLTPELLARVQKALAPPLPLAQWQFVGPFLYDPNRDALNPATLIKSPDHARSYVGADGKQARWASVGADANGRVDLGTFYKSEKPWMAYGYTEVECEAEQEVHIVVPAADDFLIIWLNGQKVGECPLGQRKFFRVYLKKGRNALVVRADNRGGRSWFFELKIAAHALPDELLAPSLLALFEDEGSLVTQLNQREGPSDIALEATDRFSGTASLRVTPLERFSNRLPNWYFPIVQKPGPGQYRYVRFAWKKRKGSQCMIQLAASGNWQHRYFAGKNPHTGVWLLDPGVPETWQVQTLDLFAHFRSFTLTGLGIAPLDGECLLLDHVYLARSLDDFKRLRTPATEPPALPKPVYLSDLDETDVSVSFGRFGKNGVLGYGTGRVVVNGAAAPKGLSMHPFPNGFSRVSYRLDKPYAVLRATAAIDDSVLRSATRLTFTVVCDGKALWKSQPLQNRGDTQACSVAVSGVKQLQLTVQCPGPSQAAHAVWVDPYLVVER
jgi:serine/threonine-protein kinase